MKRSKVISAFAVLAIVASALAFKAQDMFGSGAVYCTDTCPVTTRVNFRIDPLALETAPCDKVGTVITQPYILTANNVCQATPAGTTFATTAAGK